MMDRKFDNGGSPYGGVATVLRNRLVLAAALLALLTLAASLTVPVRPRATVRLVLGFTRLAEPNLMAELAEQGWGDGLLDQQLASKTLDELVTRGIVAGGIALPLRAALDAREAPRDAAVGFLADLINGPAPVDLRDFGRFNRRIHAVFGEWVPVVPDDRFDDGHVRKMIARSARHGPAGLEASRTTTP